MFNSFISFKLIHFHFLVRVSTFSKSKQKQISRKWKCQKWLIHWERNRNSKRNCDLNKFKKETPCNAITKESNLASYNLFRPNMCGDWLMWSLESLHSSKHNVQVCSKMSQSIDDDVLRQVSTKKLTLQWNIF